jgi:hypothetical protein
MIVLLLILCFGVSQAVSVEDVPETAYDESETLPYEAAPVYSIPVTQLLARTAKDGLKHSASLHFNSWMKQDKHPLEKIALSHSVPDSTTILNHSLRC